MQLQRNEQAQINTVFLRFQKRYFTFYYFTSRSSHVPQHHTKETANNLKIFRLSHNSKFSKVEKLQVQFNTIQYK